MENRRGVSRSEALPPDMEKNGREDQVRACTGNAQQGPRAGQAHVRKNVPHRTLEASPFTVCTEAYATGFYRRL